MCGPIPPRPHALILGGTRGLGREIAIELMRRSHADAADGDARHEAGGKARRQA